MRKITTLILFGYFLFSISINAQEGIPLTLFQIEKVLKSKEVTLKERNRLLIEGVKERGVTFPLYLGTAQDLAKLGASEALLDAIQAKSPEFPSLIQGKMKTDGLPFQFKNSIDIEFRVIPRGDFMMGAKPTEVGSMQNEKPQYRVTIGKSFFISQYEITQEQWKTIMGTNPSQNQKCGDNCPVDSVSWDEVQTFIKKLNEKDPYSYEYRLPTEAEWEYAARATSESRYYWGDDDDEKMWRMYAHADNKSTTRVGSYLPNAFGLYDMSGNVWEMVEDVWHTNYGKTKADGSANLEGDPKERVMKGGSFKWFLGELRSSSRGKVSRDTKMGNVGFRLVAVPQK